MPDAAPQTMPMIPPGVDPTQYYQQMRAQMLAQMLTSNAVTPSQPNNYGPIRSRNPLGPLAQIASALMARKKLDQAAQLGVQNQGAMLNAFRGPDQGQNDAGGGGGNGPSSAVPGGGSPTPPPPAPAAAPPPDDGTPPMLRNPNPPPVAPGAPPAAAAPPPGGPAAPGMPGGMSLNPLNLHPAIAAATYMKDPAKYAELVAGTPEWRTALAATNGDVAAAQHLVVAKLIKDGVIDLRQGGEAIIHNPDGTITRLRNPNLPNGVEPTYGPQGEVTGSFMIPGVLNADRALETAKGTGDVEGSLHEIHTPAGTKYVFGMPPNGAGMSGAPPPNVLPSATQQQGAPLGGFGPGGPPAAGPTPPGGGAPIPKPAMAAPPGPPGAPAAVPGAAAPPARQWFPPPPEAPLGASGAGGTAPAATPPGVSPWMAQLPVRQNLNQGMGEDLFSEERTKYQAAKANELQDKYGAEADLADQRMAFNAIVLKELPLAETGPLADAVTKWRAAAQEAGIPEDYIPGWAKVAPTTEMAKALVRNAIVTLKPNFGGRPAASEFQVLKEEANPSPQMTALAIKRLTEIDNELGQMQKQRATDFDWAMANNRDPARFESQYAMRSPALMRLSRFMDGIGPRQAGVTPDQARAELARRQAARQGAPAPQPQAGAAAGAQ